METERAFSKRRNMRHAVRVAFLRDGIVLKTEASQDRLAEKSSSRPEIYLRAYNVCKVIKNCV
jgi:hypothetical protein